MLIPCMHPLLAIFTFLLRLIHTKLESTVRNLGIDVADALWISYFFMS